jgi:hypothetical protein
MGQLLALPTALIVLNIAVVFVAGLMTRYTPERWGLTGRVVAAELFVLGGCGIIALELKTGFLPFYYMPPIFSWRESISIGAAYFVFFSLVGLTSVLVRRRRRNREARMEQTDEDNATADSHRNAGANEVGRGDEPESTSERDARRHLLWPLVGPRWWLHLGILVGLVYIGAVLNVAIRDPALPAVETFGKTHTEGALLAHADGFWYIFDTAGKHKGELKIVSDDQVNTIKISSEN